MKNAPINNPAEIKENESKTALPFGKSNYIFMLIGLGLIFLGYFIMTLDKEEFGFGYHLHLIIIYKGREKSLYCRRNRVRLWTLSNYFLMKEI